MLRLVCLVLLLTLAPLAHAEGGAESAPTLSVNLGQLLQLLVSAVLGAVTWLANRAIHTLDERLQDNRAQITRLEERLQGTREQIARDYVPQERLDVVLTQLRADMQRGQEATAQALLASQSQLTEVRKELHQVHNLLVKLGGAHG